MRRSGGVPVAALLREQAPEPGRCWIRHSPLHWPGPARPWLDLAGGCLGASDGEPELLAALLATRLDDLLYLPPVAAEHATARDRLAARHASRGTPVLVQLQPGDPLPLETSGLVVVWDLLPVTLAGERGVDVLSPSSLAGGAAAAWPLVAGLGDAGQREAIAAMLVAAGVGALVGVPLDLSGRDRRALGETMSEERYLRLFHGEAPSPAALAMTAARHGLEPLLRRPLPRPPLVGAGNLRVAAALAGCAELAMLLDEPEGRVQTLLRAARFAERAPRDLTALAREGNLGVLPWLEGEARQVAAEAAAGSEPRLWGQLLARLAAG